MKNKAKTEYFDVKQGETIEYFKILVDRKEVLIPKKTVVEIIRDIFREIKEI